MCFLFADLRFTRFTMMAKKWLLHNKNACGCIRRRQQIAAQTSNWSAAADVGSHHNYVYYNPADGANKISSEKISSINKTSVFKLESWSQIMGCIIGCRFFRWTGILLGAVKNFWSIMEVRNIITLISYTSFQREECVDGELNILYPSVQMSSLQYVLWR